MWNFGQIRKGWLSLSLSGWYTPESGVELRSGERAGLQPPWTHLVLHLCAGSSLLKSTQKTFWPACPICPLVSRPRGCSVSGRWERRELLTEGYLVTGEENYRRAYWALWMCRSIDQYVHFNIWYTWWCPTVLWGSVQFFHSLLSIPQTVSYFYAEKSFIILYNI